MPQPKCKQETMFLAFMESDSVSAFVRAYAFFFVSPKKPSHDFF